MKGATWKQVCAGVSSVRRYYGTKTNAALGHSLVSSADIAERVGLGNHFHLSLRRVVERFIKVLRSVLSGTNNARSLEHEIRRKLEWLRRNSHDDGAPVGPYGGQCVCSSAPGITGGKDH